MRKHLTYANVMSTLAALFALSGGVAYAANTVFSSDIVDGEVKAADIATSAVGEAEIGQGAVATSELKNDAVTSPKVLNGDIGDAARAYAWVSPNSCTGTPGTCTPVQAKGVSSVTRDFTGEYCTAARPVAYQAST
jgi:hypothetical protein